VAPPSVVIFLSICRHLYLCVLYLCCSC